MISSRLGACMLAVVFGAQWVCASFSPAFDSAIASKGPALTLTSPNGGQSVTPTDTVTVTWTSSGLTGSILIELSRDGGTNWETLAASVDNNGIWYWRIAGSGSTSALIRLSSVSQPSVSDVSDAVFTINQSQLTLLSPNSGGSFQQGTTLGISWVGTHFYGGVKIELSRNLGATWELLSTGNPLTGSFNWTVQGDATTQGLIRVTSLRGADILVTSATPFSLLSSTLVLTSPNGGQSYTPGDGLSLVWTGTNFTGGVNIDLSRDLGVTWERILSGGPVSGNTSWTIRGAGTTSALVRVSSIRIPSLVDVSNAAFTIRQSQLAVSSPNGGQTLTPGDTVALSWTGANFLGGLTLELSRDLGSTWETLSTQYVSSGTFYWQVRGQGTTRALLRATSLRIPELSDTSDLPFTILQSSLTLNTPNGGQTFLSGDGMALSWSGSAFVGGVDVHLSRDNGLTWETLLSAVPMTHSTSWMVRGLGTTTALVRVRSARLAEISDASDAVFTIRQGSLTLTSPNGGELLDGGTNVPITWTAANFVGTVQVETSTNNGTSWSILTSAAPTNGPYTWAVPRSNSNQNLVRISSSRLPTIVDASEQPFSIRSASVTISSPGASTALQGSSLPIAWTAQGVTGNFTIELSRDNGATWGVLQASVPASPYNWLVTGAATTTAKVRITSIDTPNISATSAAFTIQAGQITLTTPNGGQVFTPGDGMPLAWTTSGLGGGLKGELTRDNGATWETLFTYASAGTGSTSWMIQGPGTTNARIRVSSTVLPEISATSASVFEIKHPQLTLLSPNSGTFSSGQTVNVTWSASNFYGGVTLAASRDGGATWTTLATGVSSYNYLLSGPSTSNFRFRVSATRLPQVSDENDGAIIIKTFSLNPIGGSFLSGSTLPITWNASGYSGPFSVELSRDNGSTWETLNASTTANAFSWLVRGTATTAARIRVTKLDQPEETDTSAPFTIQAGQITLTTPNGGQVFTPGDDMSLAWTASGLAGGLKCELTRDDGATWETLSTHVAGTVSSSWRIQGPGTTNARIRVSSNVLPEISATSASVFEIKHPQLTLLTPNSGTFNPGQTVNVTWSASNFSGGVRLATSKDGGATWTTVASGVSSYNYTFTNAQAASDFRFRLTAILLPQVSDVNDGVITVNQGSVQLTDRMSGQIFNVGQVVPVTFTRTNYEGLVYVYLLTNGQTLTYLGSVSSPNTSLSWTVIQAATTNGTLALRYGAETFDTSEPFTINQGSVSVVSPNGGESFRRGSSVDVQVTRQNVEGPLTYEVLVNGVWNSLGTTASTFTWRVSQAVTSQAKIRVSVPNTSVSDTSDGFISIEPLSLSITAPTQGQVVKANNPLTITWNSDPVAMPVRVEWGNGGPYWYWWQLTQISGNEYTWSVPDQSHANAYIRLVPVNAPADAVVVGPFTIAQCPGLGSLGNITVSGFNCAGSNLTLSVPALSGASRYEWAVPEGQILSGQGTTSITAKLAHSGSVTVTAYDPCGGSVSIAKTVNIDAGFAATPTVLTGTSTQYTPDSGNGTWNVTCTNCTSSTQGRTLTVDWGAPESATVTLGQSGCVNHIPVQVVASLAPDLVGSGDFDKNGLDDLLWYHPSSRERRVWLASEEGYAEIDLPPAAGDSRYLGLLDAEGLGQSLLWVNDQGAYELLTYDSKDSWSVNPIDFPAQGMPLGLIDIDLDGEADLLSTDSDGSVWVTLLQGLEFGERFVYAEEPEAGSELDLLIRSEGRTRPLDDQAGWWFVGRFVTDKGESRMLTYQRTEGLLGSAQVVEGELACQPLHDAPQVDLAPNP